MKYKEKLEITAIGSGVENSLVAVEDTNDTADNKYVYVSIQSNKYIRPNTKIALVATKEDYGRFVSKIRKELIGHHTPELRQVAVLSCTSFCEVLRVIKVDNDTFDVMMYYNYKRPRDKVCKDDVSLTAVDLEKFIGGLK